MMTGSVSNANPHAHPIEIRTANSDYIVFHGREHETPSQVLQGQVIVRTITTLRPKSLNITLSGIQKTSHATRQNPEYTGLVSPGLIVNKVPCYADSQQILQEGDTPIKKISPGISAYDFSFNLPGSLPESIEGLEGQYRVYELKARLSMGAFSRDVKARRKVRIIRTLGVDIAQEMAPQSVTGTWPGKIRYEISTAHGAVIYGDRLKVDFKLTPLLEKLRIGKIEMFIREVAKVRTDSHQRSNSTAENCWRTEHSWIARQIKDVPDNCDEVDPELQIPMKNFSLWFELPRSLRDCRQTVTHSKWIRFRHHLHSHVLLHNPDGHVSELRVHCAIRIFLHPSLAFDEHEVRNAQVLTDNPLNLTEQVTMQPPDYGAHVVDRSVDASLPYNPFDGLANFPLTSAAPSGTVTPAPRMEEPSGNQLELEELRAALQDVVRSGGETLGEDSPHGNTVDAQYVEWNIDALSRVTSYGTAIRTSGPSDTSGNDFLPTYEATASASR